MKVGRQLVCGLLASVERAARRGYRGLRDPGELTPDLQADSIHWCDRILASGAGPHDAAPPPRVSVHVATARTPDLVRYEYAACGEDLTLVEGRNFALISVPCADLLARLEAERRAAIERIAAAVLRRRQGAPGRTFQFPSGAVPGARFSTDPAANPWLLASWEDRVDGAIRGGAVQLLCFKRIPAMVGYLNGQQWFDDASRARWRAARGGASG